MTIRFDTSRRLRSKPAVGWATTSLTACVLSLLLSVGAPPAEAGGFVFAGDTNGLDIISHPSGYDGTGGELEVTVCIDPADTNSAALETPIKNIVREINRFGASSPNLIFGTDNDIPSGTVDFESLTLHEFGHCISLAHPNLASESGLSGADQNYTKSVTGPDDEFDVAPGLDGVIGSSDDVRDDDLPLHWFEIGVNYPFLLPGKVDSTTYSRELSDLPLNHLFPANADRDVGALLGFPDTEAVMQQGQFSDEDQRRLQADDVSTLLYGMTGLDETAGTADDYTIHLVFAGITTACDIVVEPKTTGFGSCSLTGVFTDPQNFPNHVTIDSATFSYNTTVDWFFNDQLRCDDLTLDWTHDQLVSHEVCGDITLEDGFHVGSSGDVELQAGGRVVFENGTSVAGSLAVVIAPVAP